MIQQGFVRHAGLSEVGAETARRANAVTPITDVQLEYSLATRGMEDKVLPALDRMAIGVTAYGVLSRGLLTSSVPSGKSDFRRFLPRYAASNLATNQALVGQLEAVAAAHGSTLVQVAVAWVLSRGSRILPVLGSRTVKQWSDAVAALALDLTPEDLARAEQAIPPGAIQGTRYDKVAMTHLDSER